MGKDLSFGLALVLVKKIKASSLEWWIVKPLPTGFEKSLKAILGINGGREGAGSSRDTWPGAVLWTSSGPAGKDVSNSLSRIAESLERRASFPGIPWAGDSTGAGPGATSGAFPGPAGATSGAGAATSGALMARAGSTAGGISGTEAGWFRDPRTAGGMFSPAARIASFRAFRAGRVPFSLMNFRGLAIKSAPRALRAPAPVPVISRPGQHGPPGVSHPGISD